MLFAVVSIQCHCVFENTTFPDLKKKNPSQNVSLSGHPPNYRFTILIENQLPEEKERQSALVRFFIRPNISLVSFPVYWARIGAFSEGS